MKRVPILLFEGGRDTPGLIRGQPMINVLQLISGCPNTDRHPICLVFLWIITEGVGKGNRDKLE
jgi:hypothetical protein